MNELLDIQINNYEGPLDLLIHLVQKNEMNIFDVPVSAITEQFIMEIRRMQSMDMEIAADFIHMASYLIHLKSRYLLPRGTTCEEEISVEEEGYNLAQALVQLAYCKDLAFYMEKLRHSAEKYLFRTESILVESPAIVSGGNAYELAKIFFGFAEKPVEVKVIINSTKDSSDSVKIKTENFITGRDKTLWSELDIMFVESFEKAVAFATVLNMSRHNIIKSVQDGNFTDILMKRLKSFQEASEILKMPSEDALN